MNLHNILHLFDEIQDLIFSAELIADFLDSFEGYFFASFSGLGLKDVAWVRGGVPKQPEPMTRMILYWWGLDMGLNYNQLNRQLKIVRRGNYLNLEKY